MHNLGAFFRKAVDWPLQSGRANSSDSKKSLKQSAEFGAVVGGVGSSGLAFAFELSAMQTAGLAGTSVIAGYYIGSALWKSIHHSQYP